MEVVSRMKWVIVAIIFLMILVMVGWGLSVVSRNVFRGSSNETTTVDTSGIDIAGASSVRFTVDGPVIASSEQRSYTIDVSESVVSMKVFSNYGQTVVSEKSYQNNTEAYNAFLASLEAERATARVQGTTPEDDMKEAGNCATGKRFILEIGSAARRWGTSCEKVRGTAGANMVRIRTLFNKQIPEYSDLLKGTKLAQQ